MDRRIAVYEDVEEESEDDISADETITVVPVGADPAMHQSLTTTENEQTARQYVGELFNRVQDAFQ